MIKVLIIGDLMKDTYVFTKSIKISPEAPVPVVKPIREEHSLGGMANVAANLISLGADVSVLSVLGDDLAAQFIKNQLSMLGAKCHFLTLKERTTSHKVRICANNQQMLRVDNESTEAISDEIVDKLFAMIKDEKFDAIVFSDYAKGVITPYLANKFIAFAKQINALTLADPKKDFAMFKGCDVITPNHKEACEFYAEFSELDDEKLSQTLSAMQQDLSLKYPLITLGAKGIALLKEGTLQRFSALAKEVYDVSGAGDSVISALAFYLAKGRSIEEAITLANKAAAIVVGKIGPACVKASEIENYSEENEKILNIFAIKERCKDKKIVFTNGCFDLLHLGHLSYLKKAKKLGDVLVVGLNSDESVKRLKGNERPINDIATRSQMLSSLEFVDFVCVFSEDTPEQIISILCPDVLVKGADYKGKEIAGAKYAKSVELIDFVDGYSSTNTIKKIKEK